MPASSAASSARARTSSSDRPIRGRRAPSPVSIRQSGRYHPIATPICRQAYAAILLRTRTVCILATAGLKSRRRPAKPPLQRSVFAPIPAAMALWAHCVLKGLGNRPLRPRTSGNGLSEGNRYVTKTSIFSRSLRDSTATSRADAARRRRHRLGDVRHAGAGAGGDRRRRRRRAPNTDQTDDQADRGQRHRHHRSTPVNPAPRHAVAGLTTITAENLERRGISTVAGRAPALTANNGPALTNSFSAFGLRHRRLGGVAARSDRRATTLVLFDGLRAAYYPLADDGSLTSSTSTPFRSSSSTASKCCATAHRRPTAPTRSRAWSTSSSSARSRSAPQRFGRHLAAWRRGERASHADRRLWRSRRQGFNAYINGDYQKSDPLLFRDRGFPFNTADQSRSAARLRRAAWPTASATASRPTAAMAASRRRAFRSFGHTPPVLTSPAAISC